VGSAVAINPKTGGVIAMASSPGYNPNLLTGSQRRKTIGRLLLDTARPIYNRAIKGQYPPGSTFKPLGAIIALDEGLITPSYGYNCLAIMEHVEILENVSTIMQAMLLIYNWH